MPIDPRDMDDWRAADALFDLWLDLPDGERAAWLAAQRLDPAVAHRLGQLTNAHVRPRAALDPLRGDLAGCKLGNWTLESELGRGGMAVVYRASRDDGMARQHAAIKILTLAALGATGRERFQREAAILARLNHPNITPLTDSGSAADGTCWLAMPLVEGERIDRWCEAHAPDARATVRLYLQVCDAVAYAHRNLVIHRDLKPSNVLVEAGGHVRLLDFGIGQFTDSTDEATQTMWRAMTPGYAAPEQMDGAPPSTAIDVYGLGALLHRLLTGRTPQAATGAGTTARPSQLVRDSRDACHRHYVPLKNDLDRVLLKALAEMPEQRYPSAEAFSDDLRRWLDGMPVLAQAPGLGYRVRKFVARNALGVAAGVLLAASLAGGIGATLWQASVARNEAANARVQAQRAILVRDFLQHVFASTLPSAGEVPSALDLLEEGARLARDELMDKDPLAAADILSLTGDARLTLSEYDKAEADLQAAMALLRRHAPGAAGQTASLHLGLSALYKNNGKPDAAVEHAREAIELGNRAALPLAQRLQASTALAEATTFTDPKSAEARYRELLDEMLANGLGDSALHRDIVRGLGAAMIYADRDRALVLPLLEEELRLARLLDGEGSGAFAHALASTAGTFLVAGRDERAGAMMEEAAAIAEGIFKQPHQVSAMVQCQLATYRHLHGRYDEAAAGYDRALAIDDATGRKNLHSAECRRYRAILRATRGQYDGALEDLDRSLALRGLNDQLDTPVSRGICGLRASVHLRQGDVPGAARALAQCPVSAATGASVYFSSAKVELELARGNHAKALQLAEALRAKRAPGGLEKSWMRPWMLSALAAHRQGDRKTAASLQSELGEHAAAAPLSHCLSAPSETTCLVLP